VVTASDDDQSLIEALVRGERAALALLYDRYSGLLYTVAYKILGERREAEDLVHDVFLEAWRRASDFDAARGSVRAWLVMRLRSRALDRKKSAGYSRVDSHGAVPDPPGEEVPLEDPFLAPDRTAVRRALALLPEDQRIVLTLSYYEGLSCSMIAERLSTPIGTIKSRAAAALAKLRIAMGQRATE
jgi:RNA polymerase sigma-70 factor (ECF subfamily)